MTILCGTDFSVNASEALTAAAKLAVRMQLPLHLVHAIEQRSSEPIDETSEIYAWAERHLQRSARQLTELGADVSAHLKAGAPDDVTLELAAELAPRLIVIGAMGHRSRGHYSLGSHANRLAQRSHVPVLVVRDPEPFRAWVEQERPLQVMLGADFSRTTDAAMGFIEQLRKFGPCAVTAVHLYWPPQQFQRLGLEGARSYLEPDPEVTRALARDLTKRLTRSEAPESNTLRVLAEPHLGRIGDRLVVLAHENKMDLIVVGTHERDAIERSWLGSVSHNTLNSAAISVACVPVSQAERSQPTTPHIRSALVATDFSPIGNSAVAMAYSIVEPGGTVHLVHVVRPASASPLELHDIFPKSGTPNEERVRIEAALRELAPAGSERTTQLHCLESNDPASAINQAAERLGVDVICLGTRGRSGFSRALLGSVAQSVLMHTERPVLLAHKPRD